MKLAMRATSSLRSSTPDNASPEDGKRTIIFTAASTRDLGVLEFGRRRTDPQRQLFLEDETARTRPADCPGTFAFSIGWRRLHDLGVDHVELAGVDRRRADDRIEMAARVRACVRVADVRDSPGERHRERCYHPLVPTRAQVRAFVQRDWARVEASKRVYWAGLAPEQRLALASGLWQHAREQVSAWPDSTRAEDMAHHRHLSGRLREISDAFARR